MTVSILQKSVDDENLNRQVIQLNQKAENQKMRSLGINLAIFIRGVVCRSGGEGRGGGDIVIFCTNYRVGNIYRLADRLNSQIGCRMEFQRNV